MLCWWLVSRIKWAIVADIPVFLAGCLLVTIECICLLEVINDGLLNSYFICLLLIMWFFDEIVRTDLQVNLGAQRSEVIIETLLTSER